MSESYAGRLKGLHSLWHTLLPLFICGILGGHAGLCSGEPALHDAAQREPAVQLHRLGEFRYQSYSIDGREATIQSSGAPGVRLTFVEPGVVRVWVAGDGRFSRETSFAVTGEPDAAVSLKASDEADVLWLNSGTIAARIHKNPLRIDFYKADQHAPLLEQEDAHGIGWGEDGSRFAYYKMGGEEHFYGLGQDNEAYLGRLDRRGSSRDMWTGQKINKGKVTADIPIPFFLSTGLKGGGYGLFFDNSYRTELNMGKESNDYYFWRAKGGDLLYYFIYGPSFPQIVTRYTALTGRPPLPPLWTLGFIQSKCAYQDWAEMDTVVSTMRDKKIPLDAMVIDYDWPDQMQNFKWHKRWIGQSPAKIKAYRDQGIKVMISNSGPMIRKESSNYQDGMKHEIFASDGKGSTVVCGHYGGDLMDFTAPQMKAWLWPQLKPLYDAGIVGWWLDLTEPEGEPAQTLYHGGTSAKIHNVYSLLNTKIYYEMQKEYDPASRPFILTRTGFAGIQKYGAAIWSGDIASDYETFAAHCPEALNAGLSGIPLWTNDSGGFLTGLYKKNMHDHGLLYERWLQFSAFAPIARAHHVGPSAPYMFGPDVEKGARHYLELRYQLMPYIYSYMFAAHEEGSPLMRPLIYEFQDDPQVVDLKDEYLFGRELLVAPVFQEDQTMRKVYFPSGTWIDYDYGYQYQGPKTYVVRAEQGRLPLFVRAGAIIPMAPQMVHTGEKPWDPITFDIYPAGSSSFKLYADDGNSPDYASTQKFTKTAIKSVVGRGKVVVTLEESGKLFAPKSYVFKMHLAQLPVKALYAGRALPLYRKQSDYQGAKEGGFWDKKARLLWVKLDATHGQSHELEIRLSGRQQKPPAPPKLVLVVHEAKGTATGPVHMAHFYPPPTLPARVEAENFDNGGEGVAYHVAVKGNPSGVYRKEPVALLESQDTGGGYDVVLGAPGEWLSYTVKVPAAGLYQVAARVSTAAEAAFSLEIDGKAGDRELAASKGGGSSGYISLDFNEIYLTSGEHWIKLTQQKGAARINYLNFAASKHTRIVDELDDLTKIYTHSSALGLDSSNQGGFRDDASRLNRMTATAEEIVYKMEQDIGAAVVETFYWPNGQPTDFKFYLSADGEAFREVTLKREDLGGDWRKVTYTLDKTVSGMHFFKIVFPVMEPNWTPQISRVTIDSVRS